MGHYIICNVMAKIKYFSGQLTFNLLPPLCDSQTVFDAPFGFNTVCLLNTAVSGVLWPVFTFPDPPEIISPGMGDAV